MVFAPSYGPRTTETGKKIDQTPPVLVNQSGQVVDKDGKPITSSSQPQTERERTLEDIQTAYGDIIKAPELTDVSFSGQYGTTQDAIKKLLESQDRGLGGYTSEEAAAIRGQQALQTQRAEATARRQLAAQQAMGGLYGGAATAGQAQLAQQMGQTRAANEQALAMANIDEKQKRLLAAQAAFGGALGTELGQEGKQAFLEMMPGLTFAQMTEAELGRESSEQIAEKTGEAALEAARAGKCCSILAVTSYIANATPAKADEISQEMVAVRACRDKVASVEQRRGYYWFSERIFDTLDCSPKLKRLGYFAVVKPAASLGTEVLTGQKPSLGHKILGKAWLSFFKLVGSKTPYTRKNGEIV